MNLGVVTLCVPIMLGEMSLSVPCATGAAILAAVLTMHNHQIRSEKELALWFAGICALAAAASILPIVTPVVAAVGIVAIVRHRDLGAGELAPGARVLGIHVVVPTLCGLYYGSMSWMVQ